MNDAPYDSNVGDNTNVTVHDADVEWTEREVGLPPGLKTKLLHADAAMFRNARKIHFPPGYIEPRHSHKGWHCVVVLEGRMCVDGKELLPGDYIFGWDEFHGPLEYPDGFEGFTVSMGEDMHHIWDPDEFYAYERQWRPETEEGRQGCEAFDRWRREQAEASKRA
jgi:hypothetical protein